MPTRSKCRLALDTFSCGCCRLFGSDYWSLLNLHLRSISLIEVSLELLWFFIVTQIILHPQRVLILPDKVTALCLRLDVPNVVRFQFLGNDFFFPFLLTDLMNYTVQVIIDSVKGNCIGFNLLKLGRIKLIRRLVLT